MSESLAHLIGVWIGYPLILLTLSAGCGLLVYRLSRTDRIDVYVLPLGLAVIVVLATMATYFGATASLAAPLLVIAAALGLFVGRAALAGTARRWGAWAVPCIAALCAFAVYAAPVVLSGEPGYTGYTTIVDIAHQLDFAEYLVTEGRQAPGVVSSSYELVNSQLLGTGYPGGSQAPLGATGKLVGTELIWVYQPFIAFQAFALALSLFGLLRTLIRPRILRALAAFVAAQPTILYGYALGGGVKEISTASMLVLAAGLLTERRPDLRNRRELLLPATALAATFAVLSLTVIPWLGLLGAATLVIGLLAGRRLAPVLMSWAWLLGLTALLAWPTLATLGKARGAASGIQSQQDLGNLAAPIKAWAGVGPWITADIRFPLGQHATATYLAIGLALVLATLGLAAAVRSRKWTAIVPAGAAAGAFAAVVAISSPWLDLKAYSISAPIFGAIAFVGIAAVWASRVKLLAIPLAGALTVSILWGNALVYHSTTLAPYERLRDLEQISRDFSGERRTFYPSWEEAAEYVLRRMNATGVVKPPELVIPVRPDAKEGTGLFAYDLDSVQRAFIRQFPVLVLRRHPWASRPPSDYSLARQTRYHEVWVRKPAAERIARHVPLDNNAFAESVRECKRTWRAVARSGGRLTYAEASIPPVLNLTQIRHSPNWVGDPAGGTLTTQGPGWAVGRLYAPRAGRYAVWIHGLVGRRIDVAIDGGRVGSIAYEANYPGQFLHVADVHLEAGRHEVRVSRGGGDLRPGNGDQAVQRYAGPLTIVPADDLPKKLRTVSPKGEPAICERQLDWIDLLREGRAAG